MAVSNKPWSSFSSTDYQTAQQYCAACLVDNNKPGEPKIKANCHLPVKEPDGDINKNGLAAAAARLNQTNLTPSERRAAAKKLVGYYRMASMMPPDSVKRMAGMM